MAVLRLRRETGSPASLASQLPPFKHEAKSLWAERAQRTDTENDPCHLMPNHLWEPACRRWLYCACAEKQGHLHRWQASSHHSNMRQKAPGPSGRSALIPKMIHATQCPITCRSRLAGDGCTALAQGNRVACIAGKPAPTFKHEAKSPWAERAQLTNTENDPCHLVPILWEPACRRWLYCAYAGKQRRLHRWQASSHHSNMRQKAPGPNDCSALLLNQK